MAILIIQGLIAKKNDLKVLISVPTITLKEQWEKDLEKFNIIDNCNVVVVNTAITKEWDCDLLILDELHIFGSLQNRKIFTVVHYKLILGLTATYDRLDGEHKIFDKYCPPCDFVTVEDCLKNGWVSPYKEYQVIIDVDDIDEYKKYDREFLEHFEFFQFNWNLVNQCIGKIGYKNRYELSKIMCPNDESERKKTFTLITYHANGFMRSLQKRKAFINNHPKKLEITRHIIACRPNSKIITFSNSIKMAESIGIGKVYSGKDNDKISKAILDEFKAQDKGVLNTIKRVDNGLDCPGLSVGIILGTDSSKTKAIQRLNIKYKGFYWKFK